MPEKEKPKEVNIVDVVKQAIVQIKYEEIGSWLATHRTPLFYAHENGLTLVDKKFIEERPWLKKALDRMVDEIGKHKQQTQHAKTIEPKEEAAGYIG